MPIESSLTGLGFTSTPASLSPQHENTGTNLSIMENRSLICAKTGESLRLVCVSGAHRSGTSMVTRSLVILRFELGEKLMPPRGGNNAKGFFEDLDVVQLNEKLLAACNRHWDSVLPLNAQEINSLIQKGYAEQGLRLLQLKLSQHNHFAFKDPRTSKLIPFWETALGRGGIKPVHLFVVRNPLSIAASLQKRDGIPTGKSLLIWLEHVLSFLNATQGSKVLFVSYEAFMDSPEEQVDRIGAWLGKEVDPVELSRFTSNFIDKQLQHTSFATQDLLQSTSVPALVKEVYLGIEAFCKDTSPDSDFKEVLAKWTAEFRSLEFFLNIVDAQTSTDHSLSNELLHTQGQFEFARRELTKAADTIANLNRQISAQKFLVRTRESEIDEIRSSRSWKITAPLRGLGTLARRYKVLIFAKRMAELFLTQAGRDKINSFARKKGGYLALCRLAISDVRTNGLRQGLGHAISRVTNQASRLALQHEFHKDYENWLNQYEVVDDALLTRMEKAMEAMAQKPTFSIVMPVYNPPIEFLAKAIESVLAQNYPYWQLCIADDASTQPEVRACLEKYSMQDDRVKVVYRPTNGHISAASNSALTLATGDFVVLLDQDDLLPVYALMKVAEAINRQPEADLLYSDEDKIDESGRRFHPYFKTDWNPDLIYSHNVFSHLGIYRRSLVSKVGGFREGFEGSQDYDLLLRCLEQTSATRIVHIPHVLYHWRAHQGSTSVSNQAKPYAMVAGESAINDHFLRTNIKGRVKLEDTGYRVYYDLPPSPPLVSIIIPTRDQAALVEACIKSVLLKTQYPRFEILLVDNGSTEKESFDAWERLKGSGVKVLRDDAPFNFSRLNNVAAAVATGEVFCLLNNDTEVITADWLNTLVSHALRPEVGAVGARLLYPNGAVQHAGVVLGLGGIAGHSHYAFPAELDGYFSRVRLTSTFSAVTGACLVVRRELYQEVGGLDEKHLAVAFNDLDFCLKLSAKGYRCVYAPDAVLYHHESVSRGHEDDPVKVARLQSEASVMYERWGPLIANDPFYSPNLSLDPPGFGLAWPPRVSIQ